MSKVFSERNKITAGYLEGPDRLLATLPLVFVVLLASWMGWAGEGGAGESPGSRVRSLRHLRA